MGVEFGTICQGKFGYFLEKKFVFIEGLFDLYKHQFQRFYRLLELTNTNKARIYYQNSNIDPTKVVYLHIIFQQKQENRNIPNKYKQPTTQHLPPKNPRSHNNHLHPKIPQNEQNLYPKSHPHNIHKNQYCGE